MGDESYARLADALDALPNGFPRTPSGVELRLLKKALTADEAELAGHMSRKYETVSEVASRIRMPEATLKEKLDGLLSRRLIKQRFVDGREEYRLGPFIVGWWEAMMEQVPDDREFVELTQQYFAEGGGDRIMSPRPGILGVVPARGSLKPELLQPYDDIDAHFARYERFYVMDCVCRVGQNLIGSHCEKPVNRCAFVGLPAQTPLSEHVLDREQALRLFGQLERQGHVHLGFYGFTATAESPQFVGSCNCCGDCCGILRAVNNMGLAEGPQRSNYRAVLKTESCIACGDCVERCQVHAITLDAQGIAVIDRNRCIGCGLCVISCSGDAIELEPVSAEEWFEQQAGRGSIGVSALESLPVLDVTKLTEPQLAKAVAIFNDMKQKEMRPVNEIAIDVVRAEIDTRLATEVLGFSQELAASDGPLALLRQKLGLEPSITGSKVS